MNEQVKEVINEIAAQLGVASQYVVTEMAKYKIASNVVPLLVGIVAVLILRFIYTKTNAYIDTLNKMVMEKCKERDREPYADEIYSWFHADSYTGLPIVCAWAGMIIFSIIALVFLSCSLTEIITWLVAPTGSMISYILNAIK